MRGVAAGMFDREGMISGYSIDWTTAIAGMA